MKTQTIAANLLSAGRSYLQETTNQAMALFRRTGKTLWNAELRNEKAYWNRWFRTKGAEWPTEFERRFDPQMPLHHVLIPFLGQHMDVSILDVGAGAASSVGGTYLDYRIAVTPVDALAHYYEKLYKQFQIAPRFKTQYCETENLLEKFSPNQFDIVFAENTLDHHYSPVTALLHMIQVTKPGGHTVLFHVENEAERENYVGLHQWNLQLVDDDVNIWNRERSHSLQSLVRHQADFVKLERQGSMFLAALQKKA